MSLLQALPVLLALTSSVTAFDHSQYTSSPPVYPSPNITGVGGWDAALGKAQAFVAQLTLDEKAQMVTGTTGPCVGNIAPIERLGFSGLCLQDGPAAIRQSTYASVFPAGIAAASSWDVDLIFQRGLFLGQEFKAKGSHIALAPVCGPLGRSPYGGRNWEGFSPDPYLTGVAVSQSVKGFQAAGCQATTKHYIGNEQETQRNPTLVNGATVEAVSSNIDDRTMHELYLWPFAEAVRAGTASIMCSYNRLNSSYGCQNSKTLNGLLKTELGFQGYVMSDWEATHAGVASIQAGLDMDMPGGINYISTTPTFFGPNVTAGVNNGSIPQWRLDDMVTRIMTPYYFLQQDANYPPVDESSVALNLFLQATWSSNYTLGPLVDARDDHKTLIRNLAAQATVLLKNTNNSLPLKAPKNIAIFGNDAADLTDGLYDLNLGSSTNYETGTLAAGGGSGTGRFSYIVSPLEAIKARAAQDGTLVQYLLNNTLAISTGTGNMAPIPPDVCLVFIKSYATEGIDRDTLLADWNGTDVVNTVASSCNNTIVIIHGTGPVLVPFADNPSVTGILVSHFPGQETGNAIVDVLYGAINPSGHLPYTVAKNESDYPQSIESSSELLTSDDPNAWQADFTEGQLTDYRYFDAKNISVQYPFGFGLSYTTFNISNLVVSDITNPNLPRTPSTTSPILPGGNADLFTVVATISVDVVNTGSLPGQAVPQIYVGLGSEPGDGTPLRSLRGFIKISLDAGGKTTVTYDLRRKDVSYWDVNRQDWVVPSSGLKVWAGFNAGELPLVVDLKV